MCEQLGAAGGVVRVEADAYARGEVEVDLADGQRGGQVAEQCFAVPLDRRLVEVGPREHREECVTAVPGEQRGAGQGRRDPGGQADEQLVADTVPEGLVDVLEVVDVRVQQGDAVPRALGLDDQSVHLGLQAGPVEQARERVDVAVGLQLPDQLAVLGDVAGDHQHAAVRGNIGDVPEPPGRLAHECRLVTAERELVGREECRELRGAGR